MQTFYFTHFVFATLRLGKNLKYIPTTQNIMNCLLMIEVFLELNFNLAFN